LCVVTTVPTVAAEPLPTEGSSVPVLVDASVGLLLKFHWVIVLAAGAPRHSPSAAIVVRIVFFIVF
jgi:hypothetical protein